MSLRYQDPRELCGTRTGGALANGRGGEEETEGEGAAGSGAAGPGAARDGEQTSPCKSVQPETNSEQVAGSISRPKSVPQTETEPKCSTKDSKRERPPAVQSSTPPRVHFTAAPTDHAHAALTEKPLSRPAEDP